MSQSRVDGVLRLADLFLEGIQDRRREREFEKVAKVLPYQQKTQWSCSAASLATVIQHYGGTVTEEEAVDAIGAKEGRGAEVTDIVDGAKKLGYDAFDFCFDSLDHAKLLLDQDIPIICDVQSFNYEGKGHYVVLHKIDDEGCHLMDPNVEGNVRVISREYMDACWWDHTMAKPHELKEKWGVVVAPPEGTT
jgi:ABC-type bacteriocin/lantibiotic exporter with double-glycine peptidase domain